MQCFLLVYKVFFSVEKAQAMKCICVQEQKEILKEDWH